MTKSEATAISECLTRAMQKLSMVSWPEEMLVKHSLATADDRHGFYEAILNPVHDEIKRAYMMAAAELEGKRK